MPRRSRQRSLFDLDDSTSNAPASRDHADHADPDSLEGKKIYVVDSHSLIFQVFFAMPTDMTTPAGEPSGAVHGFLRDVVELIERKQPDYLFCAFDPPDGTFRNELFSDYKANREEMPDSLRDQIVKIRKLLEAMHIPIIEVPGFEADDILATVSKQVHDLGGKCYLVTGDKDCRQLIRERVWVYNIRKDQNYSAKELMDDWGVRPDQVVDFQALVGDSVDNVPGVPLIGPKSATGLLDRFGTLDQVLANAEQIKGKKGENLVEYAEQARLSQTLVRLRNDVPLDLDWSEGHVGGFDGTSLQSLIEEYGFRSLGERVLSMAVSAAPAEWKTKYELVESLDRLRELAEIFREKGRFALDTETTSTFPLQADLVGISFAWEEGHAAYVPLRGPAGDQVLPLEGAFEILRPLLEDATIEKIGQNLKYDLIVLRNLGVEVRGLAFDTMLADYLIDAGRPTHGLDDLAKRYLNHTTQKISDLIGTGKRQARMDEVPVAEVTHYAAEDADIPFRLHSVLKDRLVAEEVADLYAKLEMPLLEILAEMESIGIRVDVDRLRELSEVYGERVQHLETEIHEAVGRRFNISSPKQLAELLFKELGLPVIKRTKSGPSTDAAVLEELAKQHALPAKIVEYRQFTKLKGTYVDALPELVNPRTGRIHTSFNQVVASTGRLSSNDPNLQNIPIRTETGREIRSAFVAGEPDWQLLAADYSQIELRVLAHYCGDANLRDAFASDQDIHARVASEVNGVEINAVTSEMRSKAKAVNFGIIYGQTPFGLAKAIDITKEEAADFIDAYFERYPGVLEFISATLTDCRRTGYVKTILDRRRQISGVRDPEKVIKSGFRNLPERTAVNTVIQGSAADIIKLAMLAVRKRLREEGLRANMLLQIHDELVFEAPAAEIDRLAALVIDEMSRAIDLSVPLKVDVEVGQNWAECEEYRRTSGH